MSLCATSLRCRVLLFLLYNEGRVPGTGHRFLAWSRAVFCAISPKCVVTKGSLPSRLVSMNVCENHHYYFNNPSFCPISKYFHPSYCVQVPAKAGSVSTTAGIAWGCFGAVVVLFILGALYARHRGTVRVSRRGLSLTDRSKS